MVAQARLLAERGYLAMDDGDSLRVRVLMKAKLEIIARGAELDAGDIVQRLRQPQHNPAPKPDEIYTLLPPLRLGIVDTQGFGQVPSDPTPSPLPLTLSQSRLGRRWRAAIC